VSAHPVGPWSFPPASPRIGRSQSQPDGRTHGQTPHLHDKLRERVSALCRQGGAKRRTKAEIDEIIGWLTGYGPEALAAALAARADFETFFAGAPRLNPARSAITGLICGVRVETIEERLMREIRILDKLVDELARGKRMERILRG
jgi:hypothetical protein